LGIVAVGKSAERASTVVTGIAYVVLVVVGTLVGIIGSFEFSWSIWGIPFAAILLSLANFGIFWTAGWAMRSKVAPAVTFAPWMIIVIVLSMQRPEGDLVITGTTGGYLFMFGGAIAGAAGIGLTRPASSWPTDGTPLPRNRQNSSVS
jgi:Family of unknown function (DUF6113)